MGGQRLVGSQSVTLALLCSPHPGRSIGPAFWGEAGPAPATQQPTGPGVQDPAGLTGWPLRWWQPPGLALAVTERALSGGGVRHGLGNRIADVAVTDRDAGVNLDAQSAAAAGLPERLQFAALL